MSINPLLLASLATGICFFAWPIRMNQSGLSTATSLFAYASVAFTVALVGVCLMPGAWTELRTRSPRIAVEAGALNIVGMLAFTYLLAHASGADAPRYILIVITIQTALTGVWGAYQAGAFEPRTVLGLATALATVLLLRGKG
jgi:hypothetical protein